MDDRFAIDLIDGVGRREHRSASTIVVITASANPTRTYERSSGSAGEFATSTFPTATGRPMPCICRWATATWISAAIVEALKAVGFHGTLTNDLYNYPLLEDGARRNVDRIRQVEQELQLVNPPRRVSLA